MAGMFDDIDIDTLLKDQKKGSSNLPTNKR